MTPGLRGHVVEITSLCPFASTGHQGRFWSLDNRVESQSSHMDVVNQAQMSGLWKDSFRIRSSTLTIITHREISGFSKPDLSCDPSWTA